MNWFCHKKKKPIIQIFSDLWIIYQLGNGSEFLLKGLEMKETQIE